MYIFFFFFFFKQFTWFSQRTHQWGGVTDIERWFVQPWRPPFCASSAVHKTPSWRTSFLQKFSRNMAIFSSRSSFGSNFGLLMLEKLAKIAVPKTLLHDKICFQYPTFTTKLPFSSPQDQKLGPHIPIKKKVKFPLPGNQ